MKADIRAPMRLAVVWVAVRVYWLAVTMADELAVMMADQLAVLLADQLAVLMADQLAVSTAEKWVLRYIC
jgi:hypothetical protein